MDVYGFTSYYFKSFVILKKIKFKQDNHDSGSNLLGVF